ncbi:MAG TPA: nitroreductase [Stellaceae bacterium]|nr:nitroreductase [Stellaceae bacterium]
MDALDALTTRRSPAQFAEPAPDDAALAEILRAAMRAPDHGKLKPWRFITLRGDARKRFGDVMAEAMKRREPDAPANLLAREREKPLRAPLIVVLAAAIKADHKIPAIEQLLAAGAAAQNVMIAAHALGYGAAWKTGAPAYDDFVKQALGLAPSDAIVGFLYLGMPATMPAMPAPPELSGFVRSWTG